MEKLKAARYKAKLKEGLLAISEKDKDKVEVAEMKLTNLGEQVDQSCDSQANRTLGKTLGMPGSILPAGFDNAVLGR